MPALSQYIGKHLCSFFTSSDRKTPMHFILCFKNTSEEEMKRLSELMCHCGADFDFDLTKATDYSIILVDHDDVVDFYGPAFTHDYVDKCLDTKHLLDISSFRQDVSKHIAGGADLMNVVFFRAQKWDELVKTEDKNWVDNNAAKDYSYMKYEFDWPKEDLSADWDSCFNLLEADHFMSSDSAYDSTEPRPLALDEEDLLGPNDELASQPCGSDHGSCCCSVPSPEPPSLHEDEECLLPESSSRPCSEDSFADNSDAEEAEPAPTHNPRPATTKTSIPASSDKHEGFFTDNSDAEEAEPAPSRNPRPATTKTSKPATSNKHSRKAYTHEERSTILKYIVSEDAFDKLKGRELWTRMERKRLLLGRSWQSLKEHFIKQIVPDLDTFAFLTAEQKRKIKLVCLGRM